MMDKINKQMIVDGLKRYHDCDFTPGVYEHSIIGQAALLLEKSEEVVRCKDCKFCTEITDKDSRLYGGKICKHMYRFGAMGIAVTDSEFCSYGERKDGDVSV